MLKSLCFAVIVENHFHKMGFDKTLFVDAIPADCVCPICQDVLEEARETIICQHGFCCACIYRYR